jgi:hypothetical protein
VSLGIYVASVGFACYLLFSNLPGTSVSGFFLGFVWIVAATSIIERTAQLILLWAATFRLFGVRAVKDLGLLFAIYDRQARAFKDKDPADIPLRTHIVEMTATTKQYVKVSAVWALVVFGIWFVTGIRHFLPLSCMLLFQVALFPTKRAARPAVLFLAGC